MVWHILFLSWSEASTHQACRYYYMAQFYLPQAPETFLGRPQQPSPEFSFRSVLSSTGWRAILMGYCWCLPPDSLEEKIRWISILKHWMSFKDSTLYTEATVGKVGTLIIALAEDEGEEINKQPIIITRYQRFLWGHTPIKENPPVVRSNVMNPLFSLYG